MLGPTCCQEGLIPRGWPLISEFMYLRAGYWTFGAAKLSLKSRAVVPATGLVYRNAKLPFLYAEGPLSLELPFIRVDGEFQFSRVNARGGQLTCSVVSPSGAGEGMEGSLV